MIAHHIVFGAYGFWLPNDPRGSWSDFVGSWELFRYGPTTKTTGTRSVADVPHDSRARLATKTALKKPPVRFNSAKIHTIAAGFAEYTRRSRLVVYACAILPDHVHLVTANHRLDMDQLVIQLKGSASRALSEALLHPFSDSPGAKLFAHGKWDVFLDTPADVIRAIAYVEANPQKEGLPRQHWSFITPFTP